MRKYGINLIETAVKSAYKEPALKELPAIGNWFSFPNIYQGTSSQYGYKELWFKGTDLHGPDECLFKRI